MSPAALAIQDNNGDTVLHHAAFVGNTAAATALVNKSPALLHIFNHTYQLPVFRAISFRKETLWHLISQHEANFGKTLLYFGANKTYIWGRPCYKNNNGEPFIMEKNLNKKKLIVVLLY